MQFEPLDNERWVWAKTFTTDYSDEYLVSDKGRCWSIRNEKFVGHWVKGYWRITLSKNARKEYMMIGRLMLTSFNIPIPQHLKDLPTSKLYCMHLDGDSTNNVLKNFAWGDNRENQNEEKCRIRKSEAMKGDKCYLYGRYGKSHNRSKPILQYSKDGTFIREWSCAADAENKLGINHCNISLCCNAKQKTASGYIWKYKQEKNIKNQSRQLEFDFNYI